MKTIVIAEHADAASLLAAGAREFSDEVVVVTIGAAVAAPGIADASYHVAVPEGAVADDADKTIAPLVEGADTVLAEPTRHIKSIVGKLAAQAGTAVITDALSIEDGIAESMYFGGVGKIQRKATGKAFYTVNPAMFGEAVPSGSNDDAEELAWVAPANALKMAASEPVQKSNVDLTKMDAVVGAGRGFTSEENLKLAYDLADKIGGGVGCSRPLAEGTHLMPTEAYIGVSGLMLTPKVYVACGISGQMQHMVGINRSGLIFAINKDENAPIFANCDYGLVGDINKVIPELIAAM